MGDAALPMRELKYKERPGFDTRTMRWLYRVLYPFFHCRVNLPAELRDSEEPVVFIGNHYNVFGPVSFILSMPVVARAWINVELVQEDTAGEALHSGMAKLLPFLGEKPRNWLCARIAHMGCGTLARLGVIPVDRNRPSTLISTMRQSLQALQEGQNLVIFPEVGLPEYSLTSVTPFYSGFATLGRLYYRKTGRTLRFCPCYIDEQHHQIRIFFRQRYPRVFKTLEKRRCSHQKHFFARSVRLQIIDHHIARCHYLVRSDEGIHTGQFFYIILR